MTFQALHTCLFCTSKEARFRAVPEDVEDNVHPTTRALLDLALEHSPFLAEPYGRVHAFRLLSVECLKVRHAAQLLHAFENEPGDVDGERCWGVVQTLALRERLVGQTERHGRRAELRGRVDVDEAVVSHDEDRDARRAQVFLRARKDDRVLSEMRDRAGHERGRVVADEREQPAALAREAREREGGLRGGVRRELHAVDRLVLAVVDERGRGGEGILAVRRHVVERHAVFGVPAGVERDVRNGAACEALGLLIGLFAPGAGEDVVHDALVVGELWVQ